MGVVCSSNSSKAVVKNSAYNNAGLSPTQAFHLESKREYQRRYSDKSAKLDFAVAVLPENWEPAASRSDINLYYQFESLMGQGYNSKVKRASLKSYTTLEFAVKTISKALPDDREGKYYKAEMNILKFLDHPNIIRFFESYQDKQNYHLVVELCTGRDLVSFVEKRKGLSEDLAKGIFYQACYAVNYLQHLGVCHRYIKLDNFLLVSHEEKHPRLKLIDFGFAQYYKDRKLTTLVGTPWYVAPEILDKSKPYTFKCDNWSLGVMLYMMLFAKPPFKGRNHTELYAQISNKDIDYSEPQFQKLSSELVKLLKGLLCKDPSKRLTLPQVLQSHWFDSSILQLHQTWDQQQMISVIQKLREKKRLSKFENHIHQMMVKLFQDTPEVHEATRLFSCCDYLSNGIICEVEIVNLFDKAKIQTSTEEVREIIRRLSWGTQQVITYSEFMVAIIEPSFFMQKDRLETIYSRFDPAQVGLIKPDSMRKAFSRFGYTIEDKVGGIWIKEFDSLVGGPGVSISHKAFIEKLGTFQITTQVLALSRP